MNIIIRQLTAMYFFAEFLAIKTGVGFGFEKPSAFLAHSDKSYDSLENSGLGVGTFMDGYTTSDWFNGWVLEWNNDSHNKQKRPYTTSEWTDLIRRYSDPDYFISYLCEGGQYE